MDGMTPGIAASIRVEAGQPLYPAPALKWKRAFIRLENGVPYPLFRRTEEALAVYLQEDARLAEIRALPWLVVWLRASNQIRLWPIPDRDCDLELSILPWQS